MIEMKTTFEKKNELIASLKNWVKTTNDPFIGDLENFNGNTAWIKFIKNDFEYYINADTKREGIIEFIKNHDNGNAWKVIKNNRGNYKKVTNGINGKAIKYLYFYSAVSKDGLELV